MEKLIGEEAYWISFITDVWSYPTKSCSLLSLMAHFVHDSVLRKFILSVVVLEQDLHLHYLFTVKLTKQLKLHTETDLCHY